MRAPKCVNCGEPMIASHTKEGLCVWLCPHTKLTKLGHITQSAIYCSKNSEPKKEVIAVVNQ